MTYWWDKIFIECSDLRYWTFLRICTVRRPPTPSRVFPNCILLCVLTGCWIIYDIIIEQKDHNCPTYKSTFFSHMFICIRDQRPYEVTSMVYGNNICIFVLDNGIVRLTMYYKADVLCMDYSSKRKHKINILLSLGEMGLSLLCDVHDNYHNKNIFCVPKKVH